MTLRKDYPFSLAIDDLEKIFEKTISDTTFRSEMKELLDVCRKRQNIPIRSIYEKFVTYRKATGDYKDLPAEDKEKIDDIFHFWG